VAGLILLGCVLFVDLDDVVQTLRRLTPIELAALLLIATADRLLMGYKWALLLRVAGVSTPTPRVIRYFYQANFAGSFMPSHVGRDVLRAWWVMRDSGVSNPVFASLLVERVLGFAAAVNWAILGGTIFLCHIEPGHVFRWVALGLLAAAVANTAFIPSSSAPVTASCSGSAEPSRVPRRQQAPRVRRGVRRFGAQPRHLALNALLTVVEQGLQMLLYLGIAGASTPCRRSFPSWRRRPCSRLVVRLPIAPDGWGVGELAAIGAYGLVGVSAAEAFSVSAIGTSCRWWRWRRASSSSSPQAGRRPSRRRFPMTTTQTRPDLGPALSREAPMDLSVIAPLYNEEDNVALLHAAIVAAVRPLGLSTEIILVDDGSRDQTFARALELPREDPPLRLLKLRRNAGQTAAMVAGIDHARGRVLLTMDGDLQNDPGDIPLFLEKIAEGTTWSWAGGTTGRTTGRASCPPRSRTG
jgi:uncharacterized membrane protein YbhN (UPF0104 family)